MRDISHHSGSKYYLDKYKKKRRIENTVAIIGSSLIVGGSAFVVSGVEESLLACICGTLLLFVDGLIIWPINDKNADLINAIKAYK